MLTKAALAIPAPATPITPHNSQAGKKAPNKSNDGAPPVEQPLRHTVARQRRALRDRIRERVVIPEVEDTLGMLIGTPN